MSYYSTTRNTELSTAKYIKDNVTSDWSGVSVVKSWSALSKVASPVVCIALEDVTYDRNELGSTEFRDTYVFHIDVFATSEAMRIDLSHYILNLLNPGWIYYTAAKGAGRSLTYTSAGNTRVELGEKGDVKDKYRQNIIIGVTVGIA